MVFRFGHFAHRAHPVASTVSTLLVAIAALGTQPARAEVGEDEKEATAEAPLRPAHMPLSPLPEPPSLELGKPRPEAVAAIQRILKDLGASEEHIRDRAVRQLLEAKVDWVPALAREVDRLAERGGRPEMSARLDEVRKSAKSDAADDVLERVLKTERPSAATRNLAELLAVMRMLTAIQTTPAARELVRTYLRFGDFIRPTAQRHLDSLGDKSLAALVEAQKHPAENVARWARRQLDLRGKAIVHDLVRTDDADALADILVAIGRIRDVDAAPVLISYATTERSKVRLAARQGITLLGEASAWKLRDAYLDTTGRRPPREWTWKRTARELFTEFDRLRLATLYADFEAGLKAQSSGDLNTMKQKFDAVLLHNPLFESRDKMAQGYLEYARAHQKTERAESVLAMRRVERIGSAEERAQAQSLRHTLEAQDLEAKGIFDLGLVNKAVSLDPHNDQAKALLKESSPGGLGPLARYGLTALVVLVSGFGVATSLGMTFLFRRDKARPGSTTGPAEAQKEPPPQEATEQPSADVAPQLPTDKP